ncbi:transmembrane 220 family protein [Salinimicrobium terrae]|uniref:transmembrane 220 family protein n=1 Tax=Salinimicrobium terrae TaxID=470866 RepID=UPI0003F6D94B|nr:transmembrane 220 family protein [Salinimicrobium terrae]
MKYFNLLFAIVFIASAFLQLNDLDPLLWFAIYLSGAVICILSILQKGSVLLFTVALLAYLIYAVVLFFNPDGVWTWLSDYEAENITQGMKVTKPWIENTREFFGLIILTAVTALNIIQQRRKIKSQS